MLKAAIRFSLPLGNSIEMGKSNDDQEKALNHIEAGVRQFEQLAAAHGLEKIQDRFLEALAEIERIRKGLGATEKG